MALFNKNTQNLTPRQKYESQYKTSTANIILVVAFTAINVVMLIANANSYFLFSAFLPYYAVDLGMYLCGKYPAEYYYGDEEFFDPSFFAVAVAVAVVMILFYLLCWFMAKKGKSAWMVVALIGFAIDTAAFFALGGFSEDGIIDVVFHVWVIVSLIMGVTAKSKLKKLPAEIPQTELYNPDGQPYYPDGQPYSPENQPYAPYGAATEQIHVPDEPQTEKKPDWEM